MNESIGHIRKFYDTHPVNICFEELTLRNSVSRVLVTGGAGFIGSALVKNLLKAGYEVGVLDNLSTGSERNLPRGKALRFHLADVRDPNAVNKLLKGYEAVLHHAAVVSVAQSVEDPFLVNDVNVNGTLNLLNASIKSGVKVFVYASSSSVYGETAGFPKKETMATIPVSPYGVSKLAAEGYCISFAKTYGLRTVSLRYFNVYGPRQGNGPYSGVIPKFTRQILDNKPPLIFGDGRQTRDFVYVDDVVQANILCLRRNLRGGEVINIAGGHRMTVNALAKVMLSLLHREILQAKHFPARMGDVRDSFADLSLARRLIGYRPRFNIRRGLSLYFEWRTKSISCGQGDTT